MLAINVDIMTKDLQTAIKKNRNVLSSYLEVLASTVACTVDATTSRYIMIPFKIGPISLLIRKNMMRDDISLYDIYINNINIILINISHFLRINSGVVLLLRMVSELPEAKTLLSPVFSLTLRASRAPLITPSAAGVNGRR